MSAQMQRTPLDLARQHGHGTVVEVLESIEMKKDGQTALHIISENGHTDTVVALLERGADINARDKDGQTALHISSKNGHTDTVVALLERGADINARDKFGQTALHISSKNGHTDTVVALLERGADINTRDKDQNTPLLLSSINGHTGTVVLLLERGVDIDAKDKDQRTALLLSSKYGHTAVLVALHERGADVNAKDLNGHTAVDLARVHHHSNLVELLECKSQGALLRAASEGGDTLIVKKLLNEGADVDSRDIQGRTALHVAGNVETARALIDAGADLNAKDKDKAPPGYLAVKQGRADVAQELASLGRNLASVKCMGKGLSHIYLKGNSDYDKHCGHLVKCSGFHLLDFPALHDLGEHLARMCISIKHFLLT
ncbi:hypothetical protein EMCRGX_G017177 [Ephydatia muelleri]